MAFSESDASAELSHNNIEYFTFEICYSKCSTPIKNTLFSIYGGEYKAKTQCLENGNIIVDDIVPLNTTFSSVACEMKCIRTIDAQLFSDYFNCAKQSDSN